MRHALLYYLLIHVFFSLLLTNCGDEDDPVAPDPGQETCSIKVTSPELGRVFESSDEVNIRWAATGPESRVSIELFKGGLLAGIIAVDTQNDGFYTWLGSTMGHEPDDDFNIKVCAAGDPDCWGFSPAFSFNSTEGCEIAFSHSEMDTILVADQRFDIFWSSYHGSGLVDIYLINWAGIIGAIAIGAPDTGLLAWQVNSFNFGSYEFYQLRIEDHSVPDCYDETETFIMFDEDICEISINQPDQLSEWYRGESQYIFYSGWSDDVEFVNMELYTGTEFLGTMVTDWPVGDGFYEWEVTNFDNEGADDFYKVRIVNAADPYCNADSPYFSIF